MTWTKTSDDFSDDCWTLSDGAYRLHHEGLTWSNRKLLDCRIPLDDVRRFAHNGLRDLDELLDEGYWRVDDGGEYIVIVHHAGYQRSREQVINQQQANAENGRKGGRPPKPGREINNRPRNPVANPVENRKGQDRTGVVVEVPPTEKDDLQSDTSSSSQAPVGLASTGVKRRTRGDLRSASNDHGSRRPWCNQHAEYRDVCEPKHQGSNWGAVRDLYDN